MPVNKFGSMGHHPIINYAINLDDLRNVVGFNQAGEEDKVYGLKLYKGKYIRGEVGGLQLNTNKFGGVPINLVYSDNQWMPVPAKYNWDIDIQLKTDKINVKGKNQIISKIKNSGTMITNLVPHANYKNSTVLARVRDVYFINSAHSDKKDLAILGFNCVFDDDKNIIEHFPDGTTIVIEGKLLGAFDEFEYIITGLHIKCKQNHRFDDFSIIISRINNQYTIRTDPHDIETEQKGPISLKQIFVRDNLYMISRIRLTTSPVFNEEIKYT